MSLPASIDRSSQRGLSLVELMISITIGLLILSALTTLFVNQSKTRAELDKSNRMIDNGRYALELLSENLRLAGFYGEFDPSSAALPTVIDDPCSVDPVVMAGAIRLHVVGYNANGFGANITAPPCSLSSLKSGSDILVLRRADTSPAILQAAATNGIHYIQTTSCRFDTSNFVIATAPASFTLRQRDCTETSTTPYANVRPFMVQTYFISPNNTGTDGIPTLKRQELGFDPNDGVWKFITTPLVEGIEYMQVEYGVDGDSNGDGIVDLAVFDGVADSYVQNCADITCLSNVVSAKLHLIARNIETTASYTDNKTYNLGQAGVFGPFNDHYKRHAYTQVVRLVNPASRRE